MRSMLHNRAVRMICWYLVFTFSGVAVLPNVAQAAFLSHTRQDLAGVDTDTLAAARDYLENEALTERLTALGLSTEEVKARIDSLTLEERQAVMADLDQIDAGGDSLVTLLVIVLLVIIILKLLDKEVIIK